MFLLRESSFLLDLPDEHCHHYVDPQARDRLDILKSKLRTKFPVSVMILCVYVGVPTQWNEFHSSSTQLATLFEHHTIYLKGSLAIRIYLLSMLRSSLKSISPFMYAVMCINLGDGDGGYLMCTVDCSQLATVQMRT